MLIEHGCWFCHGKEDLNDFTIEFDCDFHSRCLYSAIIKGGNPEAMIIGLECGYISEDGFICACKDTYCDGCQKVRGWDEYCDKGWEGLVDG